MFVLIFPALRKLSRKRWVFNLDCHISVIGDIREGLQGRKDIKLISWSLSKHNFVFRSFFIDPDPVFAVDASSWADLSDERINRFRKRYRRFLASFDGFIVTYPVAFVRLFSDFGKPILVVAAIRYEHPYSRSLTDWERLDHELIALHNSGTLLFYSNNRGDADYAKHFLGFEVEVVPSVCDYISLEPSRGPKVRIVQSRSDRLEEELAERLGPPWLSARSYFGKQYSWDSLSRVEAVLYVPYNTSTMTLFELATLGIQVFIPIGKLLEDLAARFLGVMSEISFRESDEPLVHPRERSFPGSDQKQPGFDSWWLERADFADRKLMPNVHLVEDLSDPAFVDWANQQFGIPEKTLDERNMGLRSKRSAMLESFIERL